MRRVAILLTWYCASAAPAAGQGPYRLTWWDAASVTGAGALAVLPAVLDLPHGLPSCAPCDPTSVPGIDRAGLRTFSGGAATASNVLLAGLVGGAGLAVLRGVEPAQARGNAAVLLNSLAWTTAATDWLKVIVHRNRPILYTAAAPAAAPLRESRVSFPSGHAAVAFSAATTYLVIAQREHRLHRARNAVLLYAGATGVAVLRVAGGKHFPSDVAGGALLGSGIGWLVARVHPTKP